MIELYTGIEKKMFQRKKETEKNENIERKSFAAMQSAYNNKMVLRVMREK